GPLPVMRNRDAPARLPEFELIAYRHRRRSGKRALASLPALSPPPAGLSLMVRRLLLIAPRFPLIECPDRIEILCRAANTDIYVNNRSRESRLSTAAKTHAPGKKTGMPSSEPESASRPASKPAGKRIRRPAEEARRLILDAAEVRLAAQGPEGIRLQDIARDVGISHPAILHHFESREGLVRALIARTSKQLREK